MLSDREYGEIQESYLIYDANAMQVLFDRECSWLVLWQVQESYLIYDANAMQVLFDRVCSWLVLWQVQETFGFLLLIKAQEIYGNKWHACDEIKLAISENKTKSKTI